MDSNLDLDLREKNAHGFDLDLSSSSGFEFDLDLLESGFCMNGSLSR